MTINLNDRVRVTVTEVGARVHREYLTTLYGKDADTLKAERFYEAGQVIELQLWQVMQYFGAACGLGLHTPIETTVELLDAKGASR